MKKVLLLSLFAASVSVLAAGCETTKTQQGGLAKEPEGEVITGSRIRHKGGGSEAVSTMGQDAYKADRGTGGR
jgi:hypothetical protein